MSPEELTAFTDEVARRFDKGLISGPIHLNSETQIIHLLDVFKNVKSTDWVLSNWRSMYHALLHGVPKDRVMTEVLAGRSMQLHFPEYRFMTSSILGGMLPIACGLAAAGERVWCFVGDMCASIGAFQDAAKFIQGHKLPVHLIIEDNGLSTNTPTASTWGSGVSFDPLRYRYRRTTPHYGTGNGSGF